jgi:hypothetical protein
MYYLSSFGERCIPTCFEAPNIKHWQEKKKFDLQATFISWIFPLFRWGIFKKKPDQALI